MATMDRSELIMRRKNVAEFILADPLSIEITRETDPVRSEAGGHLPGKTEVLPPQTVRVVQNVRRYTAGIVNAEAGDIPNGLYVLIGRHNLDLKKDDAFFIEGEKYIVLGLFGLRKESVLATLDFYGKQNVRVPGA